jgi:plasmid replication initiation protein
VHGLHAYPKPYLLGLKRDFTKTEINTIVNFRSYYTMRIYILLKKHRKLGFFRIELADLRSMLGIADNEYPEYKRFKSRVINQAKKEFREKLPHGACKSDLSFELQETRENRKIHKLEFHIVEQAFQEELRFPLPEESPLVMRLKQYEVSEAEAKRHIEEQGEEAVWKTVEMIEEKIAKKSIKQSPGGISSSSFGKRREFYAWNQRRSNNGNGRRNKGFLRRENMSKRRQSG